MTNQPRGTRHQPLTPERIDRFLEVLAETGSSYAAAAAATPHGAGDHPGYSTFRDLRKKDLDFARRWQEAEAHYVGALEKVASKWAMKGRSRPVVDKNGNIVGYDEHPPDPRIMLAVLRRHRPDDWDERKRLEVSGTVDHRHTDESAAVLTYDDVMLLPPDERQQLGLLLARVADLRAERDGKVIEHDG